MVVLASTTLKVNHTFSKFSKIYKISSVYQLRYRNLHKIRSRLRFRIISDQEAVSRSILYQIFLECYRGSCDFRGPQTKKGQKRSSSFGQQRHHDIIHEDYDSNDTVNDITVIKLLNTANTYE
ncbi:hypothetical protein BDFB_008808, partial [Asbolus verrucosus]